MKSIKLGYILCHFPCMDLPLTPVSKKSVAKYGPNFKNDKC